MRPEGAIGVIPPEDLTLVKDLSLLLESAGQNRVALAVGGESRPMPAPLVKLLIDILRHYRNGRAVVVVPETQELTTQEAANLLGVSRPYLVRLLDEGQIPSYKVGSHRRVLFSDLITYKKRRDQRRHELLNQIAREAYEAGLYDETPVAPEQNS